MLIKMHRLWNIHIFFLKMLKDKTSPLRRAREAYILKFRHIKLAINGDIHSKTLDKLLEQIK